jgi:PAS domain S-box-containing protein
MTIESDGTRAVSASGATTPMRRVLGVGLGFVGAAMAGLGLLAWDFGQPVERQVALVVAGLGLGVTLALGLTLRKTLSQAEAERKTTAQTLADREDFLRRVAESTPISMFAFDLIERKIVYTNNRLGKRLGYSEDEIAKFDDRWLLELAHPDDRLKLREFPQYDELGEHDVVHNEVRLRKCDGSYVWFGNWSSLASRDADGRPRLVIGVSIDVTERKRAEAALEQSEARFRTLAEHARDVVSRYELVPEARMAYVSPSVEAITGYTPDEFYEDPRLVFKLVHVGDREKFEQLRGHLPDLSEPVTLRSQHKDGRTVWLEHRAVPIVDSEKLQAVECISRDITEQVELEEQLRQSQKMEAIGRLAGGVAHDFNNLLSVTLGYVHLLKDQLTGGDPATEEALSAVEEVTHRASELTRQLLTFGRREDVRPQVTDLNALVVGLDHMLRRVLPENIQLVTRQASDLDAVLVDPGQVEQMLLNLVVNARDAMPKGGTLAVETQNVDKEHAGRLMLRDADSSGVLLIVRDTGVGMNEQTRLKVFEPYFTTKARGKGTGLGLSTVYGVMQQAGGAALVESELGRGTTVTLVFPATPGKPVAALPAAERRTDVGGKETVLLVEDEDILRKLVARMLRDLGYTVLDASDGPSALGISEKHPGSIELLITDVVMPHMSGLELVQRIGERRPGTRVVYMSGYTDDQIAGHGLQPGSALLLPKPFTPDELGSAVRGALDRRADRPA